jgi:Recombination endonuclease VII
MDIEEQRRIKRREIQRRWNTKNREKRRALTRKWHHENRTKLQQYQNRWRKENAQLFKAIKLRYLYGLELGAYDQMVAHQDGRCAICQQKDKLGVDHDHATGKVRELLCNKCNIALAHIRDDVRIARALANYLVKHGTKTETQPTDGVNHASASVPAENLSAPISGSDGQRQEACSVGLAETSWQR